MKTNTSTIVGLTGLHGCGKSFLSKIMEEEFGWTLVNKRRYLEKIFDKKFPSDESQESIEWYRDLYRTHGVCNLTVRILECLPDKGIFILDAVHNPLEWDIAKLKSTKAILVGVFSPKVVRNKRNSELDAVLDLKRINYWHQPIPDSNNTRCLMSEIEWSFNGITDRPGQIDQIKSMIETMEIG